MAHGIKLNSLINDFLKKCKEGVNTTKIEIEIDDNKYNVLKILAEITNQNIKTIISKEIEEHLDFIINEIKNLDLF